MKNLLLLLTLLFAANAYATDVTLTLNLPTRDCEGATIDPATLGPSEIYISPAPIPASGLSCSTPEDAPPTGFTPVSLAAGLTQVTVDLAPGTYFFRYRVRGPGALWSNFSGEVTHTVGPVQVLPPTVLIIG